MYCGKAAWGPPGHGHFQRLSGRGSAKQTPIFGSLAPSLTRVHDSASVRNCDQSIRTVRHGQLSMDIFKEIILSNEVGLPMAQKTISGRACNLNMQTLESSCS